MTEPLMKKEKYREKLVTIPVISYLLRVIVQAASLSPPIFEHRLICTLLLIIFDALVDLAVILPLVCRLRMRIAQKWKTLKQYFANLCAKIRIQVRTFSRNCYRLISRKWRKFKQFLSNIHLEIKITISFQE